MTFDSVNFFIELLLLSLLGFSVKFLFKSRKRSAESIYKLIDDLEKKYIH